jgi:NADPH:quinone reductase-like Zn-dependent oxidoreductase
MYFHQHGGLDVLEYGQLPTPTPGPGKVLVHLNFAALNRLDLWVREGWPGLKLEYPHIMGADGAGEVAALGTGVEDWQVGEHVVINSNLSCGRCEYCLAGMDNRCRSWKLLGEHVRGTYAEFVAVPAGNLLRLPEGFDEKVAAAGALVYHTAWHSLITRGQLHPGESVLVVGASGGVNTASIQIAKLTGAHVIVVGSSSQKLEFARSMGADELIDRSKEENWSRAVYELTDRRGVDVVVDNVGSTYPLSFRAAGRGGRILTVGNTGGSKFEIDNRYIFGKHLSILGSTMGTHADFATVMGLIIEGRLTPPVSDVFPMSRAKAAQECLENGHQMGKIVLEIGK